MSGPAYFKVSYAVWKQIVQANGWATYYKDLGIGARRVWAGVRDFIYQSEVNAGDFADWQSTFPSAVAVSENDDAVALIVGTTVLGSPYDPQDGKQVVVISPATEGWNTWLMGHDDDLAPTPPDTGRGMGQPFRATFTAQEVSDASPNAATKIIDFEFLEEIEIHDGQVSWSDPGVAWTGIDEFSLGVYIAPNPVTANGTQTGNCHVVDAAGVPGSPDATHYILVPAAGSGSYDVDLSVAVPTPSDGDGFWDCSYDGGVVTPSATSGAASYHLLTAPVTSWLARGILLENSRGVWDIDVYKTEWMHRRWKLRWEVKKKTAGAGSIAGWILAFRKKTT